MSERKHIRLGVNVLASGRHDAAWKTLANPAALSTDIDEFVKIAKVAERGLIDALFLADGPGGLVAEAYSRPWRALDPLTLHAALSQITQHIGLVVTTTTLFGHPYTVARQIASLDHISKGRAAWNIITSQAPVAQAAYGIDHAFGQNERYQRAEEFARIVTGFWDSFPNEAVIADAKRNIFVDKQQLRPIDVQGSHFRSAGVLSTPVSPQGRPVIFQAGQSEDSKAFGARWADALFTGQRILENGQKFYADVKALARGYGRDPDQLLVMPGLFPILGSTEAEANRRKDELDEQLDHEGLRRELARHLALQPDDLPFDQPLPYAKINTAEPNVPIASRWHRREILNEARLRNWTVRQAVRGNLVGGHRVIVGTPEQVAKDIIHWFDHRAADGFNLNIDVQTSGLEDVVDHLIPELQKAGRYRHEYEGTTLRENLGLDHYDAARASTHTLPDTDQPSRSTESATADA
ncbi:NtaA/DmoA family FMN-dependent monooxygenase [Advenella mimigardefordensis]|uniref:Putative nitrilotriacetate monooxygenase component A n=1 Tax=Advenella mimigardefordensis (strain DSM 17166 / LMG 22922 / DPN7) TaxID=1247726 RepID=W0PKC8_ADVMD|nr:NtaA/DmoA family FMN-dependent monooxygenase [Advenella mimigardefordensis]AHG65453.1 putative nitrilotriacetate monooxygenase component A [Advenella mimigardefordensis DPN7]